MQRCVIAALCLAPAVAAADPCCEPQTTVIGGTMAFGTQTRTLPTDMKTGTTGPVSPQAFTIDQDRTRSFWMAFGFERDNIVFATDMSFGGASITGMTHALYDPPFNSGPGTAYHYSGTVLETSLALRLGARTQVGHLALAAGAGIGGTLYVMPESTVDRGDTGFGSSLGGPDGPNVDWFIPVWAQATYKTSCDWGVELLAESDRHDWDDQRSTGVALGLAYQPDPACKN